MIGLSAFTVFALGLRHGADPDHLAAIDNVTRNAYTRTPHLSRFVGTMFAGGHSLMVLAISALVGLLGARFSARGELIETIGTWVSIVILVGIALMNVRQLRRGDASRVAGAKTRLLPRALRDGTSALLAIPIGLLFGFGFETSSQVATFAVAFGADAGIWGAAIVGSMFCLGMIVTDTLDSVVVHRLISYRSDRLPQIMRVWIGAVTIFALAVAVYEVSQVCGVIRITKDTDLEVSAVLVVGLAAIFAYVLFQTRKQPHICASETPPVAALTSREVP
jgi:high-affinity nickel-transport protein